ncbi:hypothetical protein T4B_2298 [Trichinella pseudospiralis]|uniref:Uncharacterized protein n=1 Tax=Trichinella pseudospiralis TaxID=6337 RepID=A0A0V1E6H6_TRIPS|nr:hypothetical protein T4A_9272 [Trichinella pseudospiralis]KRZ28842.1 hypothetical protein T4B_2298 [Trichinella pseudospiralis]
MSYHVYPAVQTEFDIFSVGHRHLISACDIDQVSTPFPDNTENSTTKHNTFTRYKHRSIDHRTSFFTCWSSNLGHNRKWHCLAAGNGHILPPDYLVQNLISRLLMKDDEI